MKTSGLSASDKLSEFVNRAIVTDEEYEVDRINLPNAVKFRTLTDTLVGLLALVPNAEYDELYKSAMALENGSLTVSKKRTRKKTNELSIVAAVYSLLSVNKHNARFMWKTAIDYGIKLGVNLAQYVYEHPDAVIVAKLDALLEVDHAKEAERGIERVISKRNKKKQDARKSAVESKRKESAIAMMKKLVPELGQVAAADEVKRRMDALSVEAGTVRRWYNSMLAEDREARKKAEARRLGRNPP
jgi:hypothetical protein